MTELRVVVKIEVQADKVDEYLQLVKELVAETRKEEGCLRYEIQSVDSNPTEFYLVESWKSEEALGLHM